MKYFNYDVMSPLFMAVIMIVAPNMDPTIIAVSVLVLVAASGFSLYTNIRLVKAKETNKQLREEVDKSLFKSFVLWLDYDLKQQDIHYNLLEAYRRFSGKELS